MTGEELFTMFVNANLSTRGGLQGYQFEALSSLEQKNWQCFADSIAATSVAQPSAEPAHVVRSGYDTSDEGQAKYFGAAEPTEPSV